jgi:hypothetical protein
MFRSIVFACPEIHDERRGTIPRGTPCRYLFGFRMDVLNKRGSAATRKWTPLYDKLAETCQRNTSAGRPRFVFAHGVTPAINAQVVSYPFQRDTCELPEPRTPSSADGFHGLVRHKRAVVSVHCGGCPEGVAVAPLDAANLTMRLGGPLPVEELGSGVSVCGASVSENGCDLELSLAIRHCPAPTLRVLRALSVDAMRGGRSRPAVRQGAPLPRYRPSAVSDDRFVPSAGGTVGAFATTTHVVVSATLPVLLGQPSLAKGGAVLEMASVGVLQRLAVRGSLAEGAGEASLGASRPGTFRVEAQCSAPSDAQVVLTMAVEQGSWEPLSFALQPCSAER